MSISGGGAGTVARAVFNGLTTNPTNGSTFEGSFNIDRVEAGSGGFGDRIYFIDPIENPIIIVPDFQPNYDTTPFNSTGESQRITTFAGGPSYRLYFQDNTSNILLSMRFQGEGEGHLRHFVIF